MASTIDATKPIAGNPTTDSVRVNFAAAKSEIEALQADVAAISAGTVPDATDSVKGIVQLATPAEVNTGTNALKAVTPAGIEAWTGSTNVTELGTVVTGTWNASTIPTNKLPAGSTSQVGVVELADSAETITGTSTTLATTPAGVAAATLTKSSTINTQTGTTYTLVDADNGKDIILTSASNVTLTIPTTLAVNFQCTVTKTGANHIQFTSTDLLNGGTPDLFQTAQWSPVYLLQYAEGSWLLAGGVTT